MACGKLRFPNTTGHPGSIPGSFRIPLRRRCIIGKCAGPWVATRRPGPCRFESCRRFHFMDMPKLCHKWYGFDIAQAGNGQGYGT